MTDPQQAAERIRELREDAAGWKITARNIGQRVQELEAQVDQLQRERDEAVELSRRLTLSIEGESATYQKGYEDAVAELRADRDRLEAALRIYADTPFEKGEIARAALAGENP